MPSKTATPKAPAKPKTPAAEQKAAAPVVLPFQYYDRVSIIRSMNETLNNPALSEQQKNNLLLSIAIRALLDLRLATGLDEIMQTILDSAPPPPANKLPL